MAKAKAIEKKPWYASKAIWGALLIAIAPILEIVGQFLTGQIRLDVLVTQVLPMLGIALGIVGIRVGFIPIGKK